MADNAPTLPQVLRNDFASAVFSDLSAPDRNAAITRLLSWLEPLTRAEVERIAARIRENVGTVENASEALGLLIIAGWGLTQSQQSYDKSGVKDFITQIARLRDGDPGLHLSALREIAGLGTSETKERVTRYFEKISAILEEIPTRAESTSEAGRSTETESSTETEEPVVVVGSNPQEETTMEETEFEEILDKIDSIFAFDESKLPSRLHYETADGGRVFSTGQKALISGVLLAMKRLNAIPKPDRAAFAAFGAIMGLLVLEGRHDPDAAKFFDYVKDAVNELNSAADPNHADVGNDVFEPDFTLKREVFAAVAEVLSDDTEVFFDAYASVGRQMVDIHDSVKPGDKGFANAVEARYANETLKLGGGSGGGSGVAYLDLPPLTDPSGGSDDIVTENITAVSSIYVVYQCEQMMLFSATDRIVELFMAGLLPMAGDTTARMLDDYYWNHDKVSVTGRTAQYTRALGAPGGDVGADVSPNGEFNSLLMRVISSISEYERQNAVGNLLDQTGRRAVPTSGEYVRKAVRDLAANCTLYGFAGVQFAAERLGNQLKSAMQILQLPRVREIYGVNNMWQVIERVAQSEFGTTVNVVKHRTMAEEVRKLMQVIADNPGVWSVTSGQPLFNSGSVNDYAPSSDLSALDTSTMMRAAQYFLAVNGIQSDQVYEYSQPVDTPALPSIPGMGMYGAGGQGGASPVPSAPPVQSPINNLQNMAAGGRAPTAADVRSAVPLPY